MILMIGFGYLFALIEQEETTLGYVDQAGLLVQLPAVSEDDQVQLVAFENEDDAREALENEQIAAYYVLVSDYMDTHQAKLFFYEPPPGEAVRFFRDFVRLNLMASQPPAVSERILSGAEVAVRATDANREFPPGGPNAGHFLPLLFAAIFAFLVLTTTGYMLEAIVEEKENRTIEILISSISPGRLMTGKILDTVAIALLQLTV